MKSEAFECRRENLTIRGHIFGKEEKSKPAVILSHGFISNETKCFDYAKVIAALGYVSVTYDFCGGCKAGSSDGKTEDMTVFSEIKDLEAVIDFVKTLSFVDSKHISLLGRSQGGLVSAMTAKKRPEEIESLMLFYPALCIPDDARKGGMQNYIFDPKHLPKILGETPIRLGAEYARSVMDINVYDEIGGFDKPVLLLHGDKDEIVDVNYSRKACKFYSDCEYVEIKNGTHGFTEEAENLAISRLKSFICKKIGGPIDQL